MKPTIRTGLATSFLSIVALMPGVTTAGAATLPVRVAAVPSTVREPSSLVDPIDGTGTGSVNPGTVGEFPGADVPFGMMQWSPDTTPNAAQSGGLYSYADSQITGFSLTHLSGTGCAAYGDMPILPTLGSVGTSPESTSDSFAHNVEHASPGQYEVRLNHSTISAALSVTTRTGISKFTFPRSNDANLLFKVSGSSNPVSAARVQISGKHTVSGQVTSGQFCGTGTNYTLYFEAEFNRSISADGTWNSAGVAPQQSDCRGPTCGAYVSFNTQSNPTVLMKVGISFVSVRDAAANLHSEDPEWSLQRVESAATNQWNQLLGRVAIGGGTRAEQRTFYTALYHSLLHPNVVSDDNGRYIGDDERLHQSRSRPQYANFSEWDIYRSEIELESLVAPQQVSDMVQSLVNDATQGGWLPKWAIVDGDASQMNGDSADPIIAAAYAFGSRDFNVAAALKAMVKGATRDESGHGLEIERQYLSQYLSQHYVNAGSLDLTSINYSIGGSVTLEYAIDDFAIAQMALAQGEHSLYETMMSRAHNWEYLFNPSTAYVQARNPDGSFPPGPAFQFSQLEAGGQNGFEEGNAVQYTWSVPQDLGALGTLMGGDQQAVKELNSFFTHLNVSRYFPYDWAGNEPSLWTPWEYDFFGDPSGTQKTVRDIVNTLYADAPVNEPGNDDLGAISSWYVWAAMGMYPVTPGSADLELGSPLFPIIKLILPDGHHLILKSPAANAATPYINSIRAQGVTPPTVAPACGSSSGRAETSSGEWNIPWLPSTILKTGGTLTFTLSKHPSKWGSNPVGSPPSYNTGVLPAVGYSFPSGATSVAVGQTASLALGVRQAAAGSTSVHWSVADDEGLSVAPTSGTFTLGRSTCAVGDASQTLHVVPTTSGAHVLHIDLTSASGQSLPAVTVDISSTQ